jgi:hypothetical protein
MDLNLFQISSIAVIVFLILTVWFKCRISFVFNYLTGFVFIVLYDIIFENKGSAIYLVINLLFYNILFISSFYVYFIDKDDRREKFFRLPIMLYVILLFLEICFLDPFKYFKTKFCISLLPIFLAYFPLYILLYYKKHNSI